jgi:UDP-N-acetylmuramoyl-tripeptide--D-alanyl-D-alanine ligase
MITTGQLCEWSNGVWLTPAREEIISAPAIDTRKINSPEQTLFVALRSPRRDGHSFIREAFEKGVRLFLVSQDVSTEEFPGAAFIKVSDTLLALQQVVTRYRKRFDIPVIGITGSNGKTVVKEWLGQLLSHRYNTVRSPRSYNSQIGVPLSVWQMEAQHQLAIFEAGISRPGEMEALERMVQPSIGVITNIGEAHSEGFLSIRQKLNEKLVLFRHAKHLVYCSDYPELNESIVPFVRQLKDSGDTAPLQLFTWSQKHDADLRIVRVTPERQKTTIDALYRGESRSIVIPFTDPASIENAVNCWCVLLLVDIPQEEIAAHMLQLHPVAMRLELRHGINDCTIINDTYNSDLTSLYIALDYLKQQQQHRQHTVILSDMLQTGKPDAELYEEVAAALERRNIYRFIGIGPALYKYKNLFRAHRKLRSVFFKSTKDFLRKMHLLSFNKEAILLKGARAFAFEEISVLLEQDVHQTV